MENKLKDERYCLECSVLVWFPRKESDLSNHHSKCWNDWHVSLILSSTLLFNLLDLVIVEKKKPWSKLRASPWQKSSLYCRLQGNMESSCLEKLIGTKKERKPSCTLCSNHGVRSNLKGHKHHCPFLNCHCERCVKGRRKRDIMKQQVRLRRKQMKDFGNRAYCVTPSQPQGKGE